MTYLEIINKVLLRLRERRVVTPTETEYSELVGLLVNEAKNEVEMAWDWSGLRQSLIINTTPDVYSYELNTTGNQFKVIDVINNTSNWVIQNIPTHDMNKLFLLRDESGVTEGSPYYYNINGRSADGDLIMDLYPIPDANENIIVNGVVRNTPLVNATDKLVIPADPVFYLAVSLALDERGEDNGRSVAFARQRYTQALQDYIALDSALHPDEVTWEVC